MKKIPNGVRHRRTRLANEPDKGGNVVSEFAGTVFSLNWLQVLGVGESVVQYEGKAGENAMRVKRQDAVPGS
jgi:hypothetical protein